MLGKWLFIFNFVNVSVEHYVFVWYNSLSFGKSVAISGQRFCKQRTVMTQHVSNHVNYKA